MNRIIRFRSTLIAWIVLLLTFMAVATSARCSYAQSTIPIPEFTGQRVYVVGVPAEQYAPLREEIEKIEKDSPQTYYVIVVKNTGSGRSATRDYLENLVETWKSQARKSGADFDSKRSVIILVGIENRQIIVLGGTELQERFGFRDPYVERDLIMPHFAPLARSGEYPQAIRVLLEQVDRWIASKDGDFAKRRQEAAAREAQVRRDAETTLTAARIILAETRKDLESRKAAGLNVTSLEAKLRKSSDDLDASGQRLDSSPSQALDLAQSAQRSLQETLDQLRRSSALQAELDVRLQEIAVQSGQILKSLEDAGRAGLEISPVQIQLDSITKRSEEARQTVRRDPFQAETLVKELDNDAKQALEHARQLPQLRSEVDLKTGSIGGLQNDVKTELDRARGARVPMSVFDEQWTKILQDVNEGKEFSQKDDKRALAAYNAAESQLFALKESIQARYQSHIFKTRTLPISVLGMLALVTTGTLFWLWRRRKRVQKTVDDQFKGFRGKAVELMDRLDALRQRHKTLLKTDPDFTQPVTGTTLETYNKVEHNLNDLWDRWLRVMDSWEKAEGLVRSGSTFGVEKLEEAKSLLEKEGNFGQIQDLVDKSKIDLDRLNRGHEHARETLKAARDGIVELRKKLELLAAVDIPNTPYQTEISTVEPWLEEAETLMEADPLGADVVIGRVHEAVSVTTDRAGQVLSRLEESKALTAAIDHLTERTASLRTHGTKLTEDPANPDPRLSQARQKQDQALTFLRQADPAAALEKLEEAKSILTQANEQIDRHLKAKDNVHSELSKLKEISERLARESRAAESTMSELEKKFAAVSWSTVAENLDDARASLKSIQSRFDQAAASSSDSVQDYLRAEAILAEAARAQESVDESLLAVVEQHKNLKTLAEESQKLSHDLNAEGDRIQTYFRQNLGVVGPEAQQSLEAAKQAHNEIVGRIGESKPNWPDIRVKIEKARKGYELALKQAQEDVQGYQKVMNRLEEVRRRAGEVNSLLSQENKDRPPANQRFRAAIQALAELEQLGKTPSLSWDRMLSRLEEIDSNFKRAQDLANQDVSMANGAIAEISQAGRVIREAKAFYESGMTVDVSDAEHQWSLAKGALSSQNYEQAIELANTAERMACEARDEAAHKARRRRMRYERNQVLVLPDLGSIIAAAESARGRVRNSGSGFPSFPTFPTTPSNAGQRGGSWTSGADQASW